jgi:putative DNA primase/helicase
VLTRDSQFACATAPKRDSRHWKNGVVTWGEVLDWMATPDDVKEAGNYVMGTLRPTPVQHNPEDPTCQRLHRNKGAIVTRSMLTLDLDTPGPGLPEALELVLGHAALLHTTYSSTEDAPRYRLIIPLDREVQPDEYVAAAGAVMQALGTHHFDPGSQQPERYMFKPAAPDPATFQWWAYDGDAADVEELLEGFDPDLSGMPLPQPVRAKRDPFGIDGVVGAFNRAYTDFQVLIEEYDLPYSPAGSDRWHLVGSRAVAGMGLVTDGLVYSHHANDPAYGQACTAFDLVRLHRFGTLDEDVNPQTPINRLPSYEAMLDLAGVDARVTAELVGADFAADLEADADSNDWRLGLRRNRQGTKMLDEVANWSLIRKNDPVFKAIHYNEMTFATEVNTDLPWRTLYPVGPVFRNSDRQSLQMYLEEQYACRPSRSLVDWMVDETAMQRFLNPVREWLKTLEWDGEPRLEKCLPGLAEHNDYTSLVARKSMVAAVARMFEPGCKWDHTLILHGKEGLGKTHWIERMSRGWTAPLGRLDSKDTLIALQRCWIATSDEGASMRKADAEALKEFLTRREDVFRMPYEREAQAHPRHCVIWGTTNDDVFLRNQEGNRRFLIIRVEQAVDFSLLTDHYVEQVWAEAMHLYRQGEVLLFLDGTESAMAAAHRASFVEEGDGLEGMIHQFLSTEVPLDWNARSPESRQQWLRDRADGFVPGGDVLLDQVCTVQLWTEALGQRFGTHTRLDLLNIGKALRALGWEPAPARVHVQGYGPQVVFQRPAEDPVTELEDLL